MGERDGEATQGATPVADDAAHIARLEALAKSSDPMALAFGATPRAEADLADSDGDAPPAQPATPPAVTPAGHTAPATQPRQPDPTPQSRPQTPAVTQRVTRAAQPQPQTDGTPDFDTASPEELRAWAQRHPNMAKAMGLEVREHIQRRDAQFQREQQARQQAEEQARVAQQQAEQAAEQARRSAELYPAYYDMEDPRHLEALRHFAELGVQPVEIRQVLESPVVQQHVRAVAGEQAQQAAQYAADAATRAAILAAAQHPLLKQLGTDGLEAVWQECDDTVAGFYDLAFKKAGYLSPDSAKTYRQAAEEDARSRVYGEHPPSEASVVTREHMGNGIALPSDKSKIDPTALFQREFAQNGAR